MSAICTRHGKVARWPRRGAVRPRHRRPANQPPPAQTVTPSGDAARRGAYGGLHTCTHSEFARSHGQDAGALASAFALAWVSAAARPRPPASMGPIRDAQSAEADSARCEPALVQIDLKLDAARGTVPGLGPRSPRCTSEAQAYENPGTLGRGAGSAHRPEACDNPAIRCISRCCWIRREFLRTVA